MMSVRVNEGFFVNCCWSCPIQLWNILACAGTAAEGIRDRVEGVSDAAKHGCSVGNDHGNHQIFDRRDCQRLHIAAPHRRLIEADQESNQEDRERHVRDRGNDGSAVYPSERRIQQLLEIEHEFSGPPAARPWVLPVL